MRKAENREECDRIRASKKFRRYEQLRQRPRPVPEDPQWFRCFL